MYDCFHDALPLVSVADMHTSPLQDHSDKEKLTRASAVLGTHQDHPRKNKHGDISLTKGSIPRSAIFKDSLPTNSVVSTSLSSLLSTSLLTHHHVTFLPYQLLCMLDLLRITCVHVNNT